MRKLLAIIGALIGGGLGIASIGSVIQVGFNHASGGQGGPYFF